jgi:hypothetical protein
MIIAKFSICVNFAIVEKGSRSSSLTTAFQKTFNNLGAITEIFLVLLQLYSKDERFNASMTILLGE